MVSNKRMTLRTSNLIQGGSHGVVHPGFDGGVKKWFLLSYHASILVAGLLGKERWNELEELSWRAVRVHGERSWICSICHSSATKIGIAVQTGAGLVSE